MLPLGLIYAVGELLTLRSVQKAGMLLSISAQRYYEFKREDGYGWIQYCDYPFLCLDIAIFALVGSTASGRPFQGVAYVCQCTDLPASTKSMSPFGQGSGPVYVVIANMKLVALLCVG